MKFLAMSRRRAGVSDVEVFEHAVAEALQVFRLVRAGGFEQVYFSSDWKGAVVILQADSREAAARLLESLPMVQHGAIEFDLYRLDPYDHYVRLFKDEHKATL